MVIIQEDENVPSVYHNLKIFCETAPRVATGQGKVRKIQGQGILEFVMEIWNFGESQGNLRKVREI